MKRFSIFILAIVLAFMSCRKEELTPIDETTWEDPKVIDGLYFKGIITEKDKVIPFAVVEVYQNEEKVGEVRAREDGSFDTRDLKLKEGSHVTFNVVHEGFVPRAKRIIATEKITDLGKVLLSKPELLPVDLTPLAHPGSNDLIIVSGYITTPNDQPVADVFVGLFYDIVEISPSEASMGGAIIFTDENGYYDALLPKNQVFEYLVWQSEPCNSKILNNSDFIILGGLPVEKVGPFFENVALPTKNNAEVNSTTLEPFYVKLEANFLNCDNQPVTWGIVNGSLEVQGIKRLFEDNIGLGLWLNDSFGFCVNPLLPLDIKVAIKAKDAQTGKSSDVLEFVRSASEQNLGDILVCSTPPIPKSTIQFTIKNQSYILELGTESDPKNTFIRQDTLFAPTVLNTSGGSVSFYIPNYQDYSNIKLHDLTFTINNENYKSGGPINIYTFGASPGSSINGFINSGILKNTTTGEIISLGGFAGSVNIQY